MEEVTFTPKQLQYLQRCFPRQTPDVKKTTDREVWYHEGQQSVIRQVQGRLNAPNYALVSEH